MAETSEPLSDEALAQLIRDVCRDMRAISVDTPPDFAEAINRRMSELWVLIEPPPSPRNDP